MSLEEEQLKIAKSFLWDWGKYVRSGNRTNVDWDSENIISKIGRERDGASQSTGIRVGYMDEDMEFINGLILELAPVKQTVLKCKFENCLPDHIGCKKIQKSVQHYRSVLGVSISYVAGALTAKYTIINT